MSDCPTQEAPAIAPGFMSIPPPLMRVADIAKRLALSEDHVRERIVTRADFPAPAFQIGRTRRWEVAHVERWITARRLRTPRRVRL